MGESIFSQIHVGSIDKESVRGHAGVFAENAAKLLAVAEAAGTPEIGASATDWDVLIGEDGAIRMIAASDWALDSLQAHHGAQMAYRIRRRGNQIRVEGRTGARTCVFESAKPAEAAQLLLTPPAHTAMWMIRDDRKAIAAPA
jgi:hypothetical protein